MERISIANHLRYRLSAEKDECSREFAASGCGIRHFVVDQILPDEITKKIYEQFPAPERMTLTRSMREYKYAGIATDECSPLLAQAIRAFRDPYVIELIGDICGITPLIADDEFSTRGLSVLGRGNFINPHLECSHDRGGRFWRVLNVMFQVTPDWGQENGGNLELWAKGPGGQPVTVACRFNRLVVMAMDQESWHSISPVRVDKPRCCLTTHYYSLRPWRDAAFRIASFRGRPEQRLIDLVLRCDTALRKGMYNLFEQDFSDRRLRIRRAEQ